MLYLAKKHRQKMRDYNNITLSNNDSHRFFILMLIGYCVAYIVPGVAQFIVLSLHRVISS